MAGAELRRIRVANVVILALVVIAFVAPRFAGTGEGFAAAAGAVVVFLGLVAAATVVAVGLAVWTYRRRHSLTPAGRWLGYAPAACLTIALAALLSLLRF